MLRCLSVAAVLLLGMVMVGPSRCADETGPLVAGKNVPGSFHPLNVTARNTDKEEPDAEDADVKVKKVAYTTKGKYHCLVTEYDLNPVVLLFARNLEENIAFRDLLTKIEGAIERNPGVRMRSFVVFVSDDIANISLDDDKRVEAEKKIQKLADDLKLKNVVLTLASKADVAKYALDDATALTAVLYKQLKIEAVKKVTRDKLDKVDADPVKAIMTEVAGKLKATR
jgi:hypothetical protein